MTTHIAERIMQVLSVFATWLAFLAAWGATRPPADFAERGADNPVAVLIWMDTAGSSAAFVVPAMYTAAIVWLLRMRNPHAGWVAAGMLCATLLYTSAILATFVPRLFTM